GSGSESGSGAGRFTRGGFGGPQDFALPNADAGSPGIAISGAASSSSPPRLKARATFSVRERDGLVGRISIPSGSSTRASRFFPGFGPAASAEAASAAALAVP